ncbi:family 20 glycosylhydrolase [Flexivirga meconopsidis]|uniref:family 20 glycosylhydrolase n=1 Tax=Flexivirga meconopsidis TaxID=2977121 RepID=UPI00223F4748|nr:family 20 glycosylhydrolase [Flexivirga meconopsidis]
MTDALTRPRLLEPDDARLDRARERLRTAFETYDGSHDHAAPPALVHDPTLSAAAYRLTVRDGVAVVAGSDTDGLRHGIHALAKLVVRQHGRLTDVVVEQSPALTVRGVCLDVGRRRWRTETLRAFIDEMAWLGLNRLQLHLTEWNAFRIGLSDIRFRGLADPDHYSSDELNELIELAHADGIAVSVELNLPAHCTALIEAFPDLGVRGSDVVLADGSTWTGFPTTGWMLDIARPQVVDFCTDLVRAVVSEVHADAYHLGGDEWFGSEELARSPGLQAAASDLAARAGAPGAASYTPADVVVDFLNRMCAVVREAGGRAEIWSWWDQAGAVAVQPDSTTTITAWGAGDEASRLVAQGYSVVASPEDTHYVTPRTAPGNLPGVNYVAVDCQRLSSGPLQTGGGEQLAIWCDWAEEQPDEYFLWYAAAALRVFATRAWDGPSPEADNAAAQHDLIRRPGTRGVGGPRVVVGGDERLVGVRINAVSGAHVTSIGGKWTHETARLLDRWRGAVIEIAAPSGPWHELMRLDKQLPPTWMSLPLNEVGPLDCRLRLAGPGEPTIDQVEWLVADGLDEESAHV